MQLMPLINCTGSCVVWVSPLPSLLLPTYLSLLYPVLRKWFQKVSILKAFTRQWQLALPPRWCFIETPDPLLLLVQINSNATLVMLVVVVTPLILTVGVFSKWSWWKMHLYSSLSNMWHRRPQSSIFPSKICF